MSKLQERLLNNAIVRIQRSLVEAYGSENEQVARKVREFTRRAKSGENLQKLIREYE